MTVIKVVQRWPDDSLRSVSAYARSNGIAVEYVPGERTYPDIGCLFAFDNLPHARRFVREHIGPGVPVEIWEAEAEIVGHLPYMLTPALAHRNEIRLFWEKRWPSGFRAVVEEARATLTHTPHGTLACKWIKLVEEESIGGGCR